MTADAVAWAESLARSYLRDLPRRLRHVEGVARHAERVAATVDDPELLVVAAWLHDIGYSAELATTGFHPVDGAEFLRAQGASIRLCALVAHHSCACVEARRRGVPIAWEDERTSLRDALWWADMTTTPSGEPTDVRSRIAEVLHRYGPGHVVTDSVSESAPELIAAADRTEEAAQRAGVDVR
ncbi:HD domain-containing protein [Nocardia canadensis]|uniref:HD domain-containing protein n=1 Tax=Nocardia canadensis TaxID=3065238 RepID=UPI0029300448|nr:HD domain-containing protein [Nocardia canadensis]